jgi:ABC-type antimicrobial peptide transport system permease subunit
MLEQISFYFQHSLNDLRVNGRRTFFALLCIAAGVGAVVSLETVAGMIGDTLTGNLQATNRGDIQISLDASFGATEEDPALAAGAKSGFLNAIEVSGPFGMSGKTYQMGEDSVQQLQAWIDSNYPGQMVMTYRLQTASFLDVFTSSGLGTNVTDARSGDAATSLSPILIDPQKYPFYGHIQSVDGKNLAELIQSPTDIVLDQKAAETLGAEVGDTVQLNGATDTFTVRGIVPTDAEVTDPFSGIFAALFGFYYLDHQAVASFDSLKQPAVDKVYLQLQDPARVSEVNSALLKVYPFLTTTTIDELKVQNQQISNQVNQLVTIIGLVSLLLGSIGIINTMQVIVRRRTVEVAVLKTLGLQGGQVTILFLVEAFIMGVIGSLAGILLGWVTTLVIKSVAETVVAQPLMFRIVPQAVVNGLVVGTLVTTIFGFLPTLAAGQVRPGVVLRPNDEIIPRTGCLQTLLALVAIIIALTLVTQTIIGDFRTALIVTVGAFFGAGILYALLSLLIWLVGHLLPSFGIVDLKISLRQMLVSRSRAAVTLLALVIGVFSLSLITLFATSINNMLSFALGEGSGGNVIITSATSIGLQGVEAILGKMDGVKQYHVQRTFSGQLASVQQADGSVLTVDQLKDRIRQNVSNGFFGAASNSPDAPDFGDVYVQSMGTIDGRQLDQLPDRKIEQGRQLTAADAGQPVMVVENNEGIKAAGITVGDKLTYRFGEGADAPEVTFEVVGMTTSSLVQGDITGSGIYVPLDALPRSIQPAGTLILADIATDQIPELRRQVSSIPGTFVLETAFFTKLISSLLGTFTAFPTMVALLGLIVGGVVIANSVALATLERRREIAVMKAVGLQRERVLGMLLLENGILGLVGGLIGVGIGLVALVMLVAVSNGPSQAIPYGTALLLMGLCIAVALIAALTTAWGASGEKPLNVLRYE